MEKLIYEPQARGLWRIAVSAAILLGALIPTACTTPGTIDTSSMTFSAEPLVGKVVWNDLITDDADAARRFYGELFGWTFQSSTGRQGQPYWLARHGDIYVGGILSISQPPDTREYSRWLPYVSVTDVDAAVAKATARGGRVVASGNVNMGRIAAIVDAEGAVIGLARSRIGDPSDSVPKTALGRVLWNELLSDDPQRAARFYADVVGYGVNTIERRGGQYTVLTGAYDAPRAGIQPIPDDKWDPVWLTSFGVDDPALAAAKAESLGGKILLPASEQVREGSIAVIADPTGAILVLQKAPT